MGPKCRHNRVDQRAVQKSVQNRYSNARNPYKTAVPRGTALRYKPLRAVGRLRPAVVCTVPSPLLGTVQRYKDENTTHPLADSRKMESRFAADTHRPIHRRETLKHATNE